MTHTKHKNNRIVIKNMKILTHGGSLHHLKKTPHNIDILKKELKHININPHHKKTHKRISI